jgi:diguanylate cyclase (GGDEF)-like protein
MHDGIDHDKLLAALTDLPRIRSDALRTLPGILTRQGEGHTTVSIVEQDQARIIASNDPLLPEGLELPVTSVVMACAQLREPIYLSDAPADRRYHAPYGRLFPVELALPIFERGCVVAVLNIEREQPFTAAERRTLELFVTGVGEKLTERSQGSEATMIAELSRRLADISTLEAAAEAALDVIVPLLGAQSGTILDEQPGRLEPLAARGGKRDPQGNSLLDQPVPYPEGLSWRTVLTGEVQFVPDYSTAEHAWDKLREHLAPVVLVHPISRQGVCRTVLTLHLQYRADISEADIVMIESACRHLAVTFNAIRTAMLQDRLLELQTVIAESGTHQLYQQILETAIALVPGAESGTLLVRPDFCQPFRFQAAVGQDLASLQTVEFDERHMRAWHEKSEREWLAGEIRILERTAGDPERMSIRSTGRDRPGRVGQPENLLATASLPVVYRGQVLAVLNLDNLTRTGAFSEDSLHALRLFKAPVAAMLQAAHYRDAIVRLSLTDDVTGLPNRRGFEGELQRMQARAVRSGEPFTLLMMDMTDFKAVNDTLGHQGGDEALQAVARALTEQLRAGDVVARWGGDEFTALLPGVNETAAALVSARFQTAVARLKVAGSPLKINIGAATYPHEGLTGPDLLRLSDQRMYLDKQRRKQEAETV